MVRKLEAEGLNRSNRLEYLLEAVLKTVLLHYGFETGLTQERLEKHLYDPNWVHVAKPVIEPKMGGAAQMRKAEQDVGEWMVIA